MTSDSQDRQKTSRDTAQVSSSSADSTAVTAEQLSHVAQNATAPGKDLPDTRPVESGGQSGPEPTRYGDWEKKGRCTDF